MCMYNSTNLWGQASYILMISDGDYLDFISCVNKQQIEAFIISVISN